MTLTISQLEQCLPHTKNIEDWFEAIDNNIYDYNIDTPERIAAFLSQCAHESQDFTRLTENLNYRWETLRRVFPKRFPTDAIAKQYAHNKEAIANRAYANKIGNGDEASGDGWRFRGRGAIQITGKANYEDMSKDLDIALRDLPEFLETFDGAILAACWFWDKNNLNRFADAQDIKGLTKAINGGFNGLEDRIDKYEYMLQILTA